MTNSQETMICAVIAEADVVWKGDLIYSEEALISMAETHKNLTYDAQTKKLYYKGSLNELCDNTDLAWCSLSAREIRPQ